MTQQKKVAVVIGDPVEHSLSPMLHGHWLKEYGIDGEYKKRQVREDELEDFLVALHRAELGENIVGCNITVPHKIRTFELLQDARLNIGQVTPLAQSIGSVNTIIRDKHTGKLTGGNTDAYGFKKSIDSYFFNKSKSKAVVLGAGGAASPIWNIVIGMGFKEVILANRTKEKIINKTPMLDRVARSSGAHYTIQEWTDWPDTLKGADLLVNTTSMGLTGNPWDNLDLVNLPEEAIVTDIVYSREETPFVAAAKAHGCKHVFDGLEMLLHQAAPGFSTWFLEQPFNEMPDQLRKPEVTNELRDIILRA